MNKIFGYIVIYDNYKTQWKKIEIKEQFSFMGYSLMVHKDYKDDKAWVVTEKSSGAIASNSAKNDKLKHKTPKSAIDKAKENISNYLGKGNSFDELILKFRERIEKEKIEVVKLKKLQLL